MSKINSFLSERLKQPTDKLSKMADLAQRSSSGGLSSFSGVFGVQKLTVIEEDRLRCILDDFSDENVFVDKDFEILSQITSEVKAIANQAAMLHGERIKKVQEILKNYKEGAFSAWLQATYGNRQTPYNFLQYYELHTLLPQLLHPQLDSMPRQIVYILASRDGDFKLKEEIIRGYQGQPKDELLALIRKTFPLSKRDKRAQDFTKQTVAALIRIRTSLDLSDFDPSKQEKKEILEEVKKLWKFIKRRG